MTASLSILLLADSHIGFDLPVRPRISRRRRGHDFLANYATALAPALAGEVDVVVHGGDVFDRSRVAPSVAYQAFDPLLRVADSGVPVFVVPGNHERSRLPHSRLARHPNVHIFERPRTFVVKIRGTCLALAGFPSERRVRMRFRELLEQTGWTNETGGVRLLCMHQCVEGATVGPGNFTFTTANDVIRARDLPGGLAAVLSGHIHRHQVLMRDLRHQPLAAPVLYPGSLERTSFAEAEEPKGFMLVHVTPTANGGNVRWQFRQVPARPMLRKRMDANVLHAQALESQLRAFVATAPSDAVITIRVDGTPTRAHLRVMSAAHLRTFVPETMNVDVRAADGSDRKPAMPRRPHARTSDVQPMHGEMNLRLEL